MKRWMAMALVCALLACPAAQAETALMKLGDRGDGVAKVQARLIALCFLDGEADGIFGKATRAAVVAFQKHLQAQGREASADGIIGPQVTQALEDEAYNSYLCDVALDDQGDEARRVQKRLIALNYLDDTADGHFGVDTQAALLAFERAHDLEPDGVAGEADFALLFSDAALRAEKPVRRTLEQGDDGQAVAELQRVLIRLGFLAGVDDGHYGDATVTALSRLRDHLLELSEQDEALSWVETLFERTDVATPLLQEQLIDGVLPFYAQDVSKSTRGDALRRVQRRLHTLYYLDSTDIDGVYGKTTAAAIQLFQQRNGLEESSTLDRAAQQILFSDEARPYHSAYQIHVSIDEQMTRVYRLQEDDTYVLDREMICTTGMAGSPTPTGIFTKTRRLSRWHFFTKYNCWAQNTFQIQGNIWFHSVLFYRRSSSAINHTSVNNLGRRASHGCVRLSVEDSLWVFENCPSNTTVVIR